MAEKTTPGRLFTRKQSADYIRDELGVPFSFSTATKLAALGEFCEPAMWWGRRPLYSTDDLRAWVQARSRPNRTADPDNDTVKDVKAFVKAGTSTSDDGGNLPALPATPQAERCPSGSEKPRAGPRTPHRREPRKQDEHPAERAR